MFIYMCAYVCLRALISRNQNKLLQPLAIVILIVFDKKPFSKTNATKIIITIILITIKLIWIIRTTLCDKCLAFSYSKYYSTCFEFHAIYEYGNGVSSFCGKSNNCYEQHWNGIPSRALSSHRIYIYIYGTIARKLTQ